VSKGRRDLRIRPAGRGDGSAILVLERELADFERLSGPSHEEGERLLAWIFDEERFRCLVAERDSRVCGIALYFFFPTSFRARPALYLEDIVISEAERSSGVGEALMRELARIAVESDCCRMEWAVLPWNEGALRFYRRIGARAQTAWERWELDEAAFRELAAGK